MSHKTEIKRVRCTVEQAKKLEKLGGAEWVRGRIDAAVVPTLAERDPAAQRALEEMCELFKEQREKLVAAGLMTTEMIAMEIRERRMRDEYIAEVKRKHAEKHGIADGGQQS